MQFLGNNIFSDLLGERNMVFREVLFHVPLKVGKVIIKIELNAVLKSALYIAKENFKQTL